MNEKPITILMAEDDADDRELTLIALEEAKVINEIKFVEDGEELMDYLRNKGKYSDTALFTKPGLILLDLNMPKKDGRECLKEIKADDNLKRIPIVVLTTSNEYDDIYETYNSGVNSFITKPVTFTSLVYVMQTLHQYWFEIVELPVNGV